jgi:hypothetical protein
MLNKFDRITVGDAISAPNPPFDDRRLLGTGILILLFIIPWGKRGRREASTKFNEHVVNDEESVTPKSRTN